MDTATGSATNQVADAADSARDKAADATSAVQDKLYEAAGQAKQQAAEGAEQAKSGLRDQIDERSTRLAVQAKDAAGDLRTVSDELRGNGRDQPARIAEQIADRVERAAGYLERSDGAGLLRDLEDFGRKRPWAVIAGGAALGFAASRLLKSSSAERYHGGTARQAGPSTADLPKSTALNWEAAGGSTHPAATSNPIAPDTQADTVVRAPGAAVLPGSAPFVPEQGTAQAAEEGAYGAR